MLIYRIIEITEFKAMRGWGQELLRFYNYFRRPRVTIVIIAVLLVLFLAGIFIPQRGLFTQAQFEHWNADHPVLSGVINSLKLNEIYVAPVTIFFLALFFLNLVAVLLQRVPHILRRAYIIDRRFATVGIEKVKDDPGSVSIVIDGLPPDSGTIIAGRAASFFRKRFWSVMTSDDARSFIAVRNRLSPLGFLLFHVSFLFCLGGGLLVMYTRFSGNLLLSEGEEFHSDIAQFRNIKNDAKIFRALPELGITLRKVFPSYEGSTGTDLSISMRIQYFSETQDAIVKVNEPIKKGAVSILSENIGVSPLFLLRRKGGEEVQGGYFSLNVLKGDEDSFQFAGFPYTIFVKFYPDYAEDGGKPMTRSLAMKNPVFRLRIEKQGRILYDALRKRGEWAAFDDLELSCGETRYWVDFLVVREYGTTPLFAGFLFGSVGLILRLLFVQKTIRVHIEKRNSEYVLYVNGSGEFYPQAFREEFDRLTSDLGDALKGGRREGVTT